MRVGLMAATLGVGAVLAAADASADPGLTRGSGKITGTLQSGWTFNDGSASFTYRSRPQSQKDTTVAVSWKMPATSAEKGTLTVSVTGGDLDGYGGGVTVTGDSLGSIVCKGITSGGPNSGCN